MNRFFILLGFTFLVSACSEGSDVSSENEQTSNAEAVVNDLSQEVFEEDYSDEAFEADMARQNAYQYYYNCAYSAYEERTSPKNCYSRDAELTAEENREQQKLSTLASEDAYQGWVGEKLSGALLEETPNIEVSVESKYVQPAGVTAEMLVLTSVEDYVTVEDVRLNGGRCPNPPFRRLSASDRDIISYPVDMVYGNRFIVILNNCNIREADVLTNNGFWTFKFN